MNQLIVIFLLATTGNCLAQQGKAVLDTVPVKIVYALKDGGTLLVRDTIGREFIISKDGKTHYNPKRMDTRGIEIYPKFIPRVIGHENEADRKKWDIYSMGAEIKVTQRLD
jgi:hypothetical protein